MQVCYGKAPMFKGTVQLHLKSDSGKSTRHATNPKATISKKK